VDRVESHDHLKVNWQRCALARIPGNMHTRLEIFIFNHFGAISITTKNLLGHVAMAMLLH